MTPQAHPRPRRFLVPAVCDVSVTNVCNATCRFCSFARDKGPARNTSWIDPEKFAEALPIMYRRGIRHLTFQGGEPLLHPAIEDLISQSRSAGMRVGLITNGWLLSQHIEPMAKAGLSFLFVSIDSHSMEEHERNRGLPGLGGRIRDGLILARRLNITTLASVAMSRLVDFERLPLLLLDLAFEGVNFSYPRRDGSSRPLAFGAETPLTDYDGRELTAAFEAIKTLKRRLSVVNPTAGIEEMERRLRGEEERFPCVGGHKYFCLDWNLDIWRCEAWPQPMGPVFDFDRIPDQRDRCTDCMISCYRDGSVLMHAGIAARDAASDLAAGRLERAMGRLFRRTFFISLSAIAEQLWLISRLQAQAPAAHLPRMGSSGGNGRKAACVILVPDEKGMLPVFGLPAVRRLVLLARRAHLEPVYLIGRVELVQQAVFDLLPPQSIRPVEDPEDLERAIRELPLPRGTEVIVTKANHVIDQSLSDLVRSPPSQRLVPFLEEGKERAEALYLCEAGALLPLSSGLLFGRWSREQPYSGAVRIEGTSGLPCAVEEGTKKMCEAALIASSASHVKGDDSFLSRHVNRHISRLMSSRIVATAITANQITLVNGAIGVAGAFLLSMAGYWHHLAGTLLFLFCVIMDGADGEVARLKLGESSFGRSLDYAVDNVVHVAVFIGIAAGLYHETGRSQYILALSLLLVGFGLCALVVYRRILKRSPDELQGSPRLIRLMATLLTNRDFAYVVLAFAIVGRLDWFLWATAWGTYLFAAVLEVAAFKEKRARASLAK
jgi:MoaA/NifB/PqqE/SkfB family radical SAM enzyme/phosphatidylglycerophosphate synthase